MKRNILRSNVQFKSWLNQLSLPHEASKKSWKERKQKKPRNFLKIPWDLSEKVRETTVRRIYGKCNFWVWIGRQKEWCIMKEVMVMMMMMTMMRRRRSTRWWTGVNKDEMTVTGTHHRQVGEVLQEVHSRDEVRHGGKSGYWLLKRSVQVDEQGWQHQRNECCDGRSYEDMKVRWC